MLSTYATFSSPSMADHRWSEMIAGCVTGAHSFIEIIEWSAYLFDPCPHKWHEPPQRQRWWEQLPGYTPEVLIVDNPMPEFFDLSVRPLPADRYAYINNPVS
jgi:hypothetical protein